MTVAPPHVVDPVAAATYFVERLGFTAFPVWASDKGKCRCGDPHDGSGYPDRNQDNIGKHPATGKGGFKKSTNDVAAIRTFLGNHGTPNFGLNAPEDVLAFDVDGDADGRRWDELQGLYGTLPVTLTTTTAHGRHYFFRWPSTVGKMPKGKLFGFVVRRHDDGYVIGPGSIHPTGIRYDTLRQTDGMPYDIAELPLVWAEAALKPKLTIVGPRPLPEKGGRHDWLRDRARHLRGVIDEPDVLKAALLAENSRLAEPKSADEVDRAIGDVFAKFGPDPVQVVDDRAAAKLGDELDLLGMPTTGEFPEAPAAVAYDGLLGGLVDDLASGTDASLTGLMGSLLAFCGALVPGTAYFHRLQTSSPYIALVGESSIGRKGTAMTRVMDAMSEAVEVTTVNRAVLDGVNSGEGLVAALYNKREHYALEPTVGLVFEEEYATLLAARGRDGSTLDPKMRQAFDGGPLSNRRSGETKTVNPPYWVPALIGITPVELRQRLEPGALQSGSANRWLYLPVIRRDIIPTNTAPVFSPENRTALIDAHRKAAKKPPPLAVDPVVTRTLSEYADFLPGVSVGLGKDLTRRLAIIAFRVALVHALVERASSVAAEHLERAVALTEYARRGIAWVFGDTIGNPDANLLFRHLVATGRLTRTTITREIIRDPIRRQAAIDELLRIGRARIVTLQTAGRARLELQPVTDGPTSLAYFQVLSFRTPNDTETVEIMERSPVLSTNDLGKNVERSREEVGKNLADLEQTQPEMKNVGRRPDGSIWCGFMVEHYSMHRDVSSDPWCESCSREGHI